MGQYVSHTSNVIKVNLIDADTGIHTDYAAQLPGAASIQLSITRPFSILLALMLPATTDTGLAS